MKLKRTTLNLEVRADNDTMEFEGIANGFHTIDCYGCIMARGAFKQDLPLFLQDGFIGGINHDWNKPIGKPLAAAEVAEGLSTRARLSDTDAGREVHTLLKDNVIKRLSIGFQVLDYEYLEDEKAVAKYWEQSEYTPSTEDHKSSKYGALLMKRVRLFEYSPVMYPGNALTGISEVRAAPPAGQPLEDHLNSVLATDEELLVRIETLLQKRSEEGRKLSAAWQIRLRKLRDQYDGMLKAANAANPDRARQKRMNAAAAQECLAWLETI